MRPASSTITYRQLVSKVLKFALLFLFLLSLIQGWWIFFQNKKIETVKYNLISFGTSMVLVSNLQNRGEEEQSQEKRKRAFVKIMMSFSENEIRDPQIVDFCYFIYHQRDNLNISLDEKDGVIIEKYLERIE